MPALLPEQQVQAQEGLAVDNHRCRLCRRSGCWSLLSRLPGPSFSAVSSAGAVLPTAAVRLLPLSYRATHGRRRPPLPGTRAVQHTLWGAVRRQSACRVVVAPPRYLAAAVCRRANPVLLHAWKRVGASMVELGPHSIDSQNGGGTGGGGGSGSGPRAERQRACAPATSRLLRSQRRKRVAASPQSPSPLREEAAIAQPTLLGSQCDTCT